MSAPFDPVTYIADMRAVGAVLTPYTVRSGETAGRRQFEISGKRGVPGDVVMIGIRHEAAALGHPDWIGAVHDALVAETGHAA